MASGHDAGQTPIERAVDLLVYAPLGLLYTARDELPRLIDKGRSSPQVGAARMVGRFAVHEGQKEAGKVLRRAAERLSELGLVPDPRRDPGGADPAAADAEPEPSSTPRRPSPAKAGAGDAGSLAIPGYDSLSASQVVQRLDGLAADELEAVRAYEAASRGRKTILSRVAQLQSAS